jgi:fido (protein-threonine AMPylation protein)
MNIQPDPRAVPTGPVFSDAEIDDLIPTHIASRADLGIAEQANIESATRWAFGPRPVTTPEQLLTTEFSDQIHRRMFGDVWRSAGQHSERTVEHDLAAGSVAYCLKTLFDVARFWHEHQLHTPAERAVRLHHELLEIRAYRSGNGPHARFMADLYLHLVDAPRLPSEDADVPEVAAGTHRANVNALQDALDSAARAERFRLRQGGSVGGRPSTPGEPGDT